MFFMKSSNRGSNLQLEQHLDGCQKQQAEGRQGQYSAVSTHDPDFSDQIRILLESGNVEDDGEDGDIDDVDDSDADPDFVIEDINRQYEDSSGSEDEYEALIEEEDNEDEGNYIVNE